MRRKNSLDCSAIARKQVITKTKLENRPSARWSVCCSQPETNSIENDLLHWFAIAKSTQYFHSHNEKHDIGNFRLLYLFFFFPLAKSNGNTKLLFAQLHQIIVCGKASRVIYSFRWSMVLYFSIFQAHAHSATQRSNGLHTHTSLSFVNDE